MIASAAAVRLGHIAVTRSSAIGDKLLLDEADKLMYMGRKVKSDRGRAGNLGLRLVETQLCIPQRKMLWRLIDHSDETNKTEGILFNKYTNAEKIKQAQYNLGAKEDL